MAANEAVDQRVAQGVKTFDYEPNRFFIGYWHSVSITVWGGGAGVEGVQRAKTLGALMVRNYPDGHSNVGFLLEGITVPAPEERQAFGAFFNRRASDLRCMGIVVEGDGFGASALRSTATNLNLCSPEALELRVHTGIEELCEWLPEAHYRRTGQSVEPSELAQALHYARYHVAPQVAGVGG